MFDPREQAVGLVARWIGKLIWDPPPWWTAFRGREFPPAGTRSAEWAGRIFPLWARLKDWAQRARVRLGLWAAWAAERSPGRRQLALIGGLTVVMGLWLAQYYRSRPELAKLSVRVEAPAATPVVERAEPYPLRLQFSGSAARLADLGKPVARGVTLLPPIPGEWRWETDSILAFSPRSDWPVGRQYSVRIQPELLPDHLRLEEDALKFETARFSAQLVTSEFYQDPTDPKLKKAVWTLAFSHPVHPQELESRVRLDMAGRTPGWFTRQPSFPFTVSYDPLKGRAFVHSGTIKIPDQETSITLSVEGGVRSSRGGAPHQDPIRAAVAVPGMFNYFRLADFAVALPRNDRYEPEQALVLSFSAGVRENVVRKHVEAWALPKDLPLAPGRPGSRDYSWHDVSLIGPEVLAAASKLELQPLPADKDFATVHSFKFKAPPGRYLYVRVNKGAECYGGYVLAKTAERVLQVPEFPRELRFLGEGALLSLAGDRRLSVLSRGVQAIRFQIGRVLPNQVNHLVSQSGGRFQQPRFDDWRFGMDNLAERFEETVTLASEDPGKTQYSGLELGRYLGGEGAPRGLFFLKAEGWDTLTKRPVGIEDGRLVLVTDLGILVKDNRDHSHDVFVQSIKEGEPAAGVRVEVLGKNGLPVLTAVTDARGRASFPSLEGFSREKQPVAFVARLGSDLSFIPFRWADRRLDVSRFDVGGLEAAAEGSLNAFLFSDRGVYRPGEEIRVGVVVKGSDWTQPLAGVPLELSVTDPRGLEVLKRRIRLSASGFEELKHATDEASPTGRYQVSLYIVKDDQRRGLLGSVEARVEEFLPDRLRIATRLSTERERGWVSPEGLKGRVSLHNLFGTPAEDRRVAAMVALAPAPPAFATYPSHVFFDPKVAKNSFSERLADGRTNAEGEAEFDLELQRFEKATYRLVFSAEGFEAGAGRSVASQSSILVSDLKFLLGYKPDGELSHVHKGSTRTVELIAVDPSLAVSAVEGLSAVLVERRYVSVLQRQDNGTYKYESLLRETEVERTPLSLPAAGLKRALRSDLPGDFALLLKDKDDVELLRVPYSVVGSANLSRSLEKNAELEVRLDRADYAPGSEIEVQLRAPYTGAGLITIERDKVYAARWFKTATTGSIQRIRVPEGLEGNAYVHVSFLRAVDSPEVFMSPLSYGIAPFSLSRERRTNRITLETPDLARPGEPYRIRYSSSRRGRMVVYAVDEGILQVARYKTPDPLSHFFAKRSLGVKTFQILDLLLPEFKLVQAFSAPGGDEGSRALGKNLNPFKRRRDPPVAFWSGIVEAGPEPKELVYEVPGQFSGSLKVMAVAVSADAVGAAEARSTVRGHFTLTPNVPTFATPGDEFTVTVGVANHVEGSGPDAKAQVSAAAGEQLELVDGGERAVAVGEGREQTAVFKVRARKKLGSGRLLFAAQLGEKRSKVSVELSVRPAVPYRVTSVSGYFRDGSARAPTPRRMYPEYRKLQATASSVPLVLARGLIAYLEKFPYGCTEQTVSRGWPAFVLGKHPEFGYGGKAANEAVERVVAVLRSRQNAEGAFGVWAANSHTSDFHAVYAMHFLTDAAERGHPVPSELITRGLVYLRSLAAADSPADVPVERLRAYAAYLLVRNGVIPGNWADAIEARLESRHGKTWRTDLAAGYLAAAHRLMKADSKADRLIRGLKLGEPVQEDYDRYYDGLTRDAQVLYLLARHFPERLEAVKGAQLQGLADSVAGGRYNTLSAAYTVLGLAAYVDATGTPAKDGLAIQAELPTSRLANLPAPVSLFSTVSFPPDAVNVRFASAGLVFYQTTQAGFDLELPQKEVKGGIEVQREFRDPAGNVATSAKLGEELEVRLRVRSIDGKARSNVALVDLLPGGFEPVLDSVPRVQAAEQPVRSYADDYEGEGEGGHDAEVAAPPGEGGSVAPVGVDYVDVREDRLVVFGAVAEEAREFKYRIKATNRGAFVVPPAMAESMYDRGVQALGLADRVRVE